MKYSSTRGKAEKVSAGKAILKGIATDGGLYVPSSFDIITREEFDLMEEMSYPERAALILSKFLKDYSEEELKESTEKAYSRFDGDPAPLIKIDENTYIMELFHGPTLAFKDMALTVLPYLMTSAKKREKQEKKTLILTATSGDTGKAAIEGFSDIEGIDIIVLYPEDGVSEMQKRQMLTSKGKNVSVIGIKGNFDDAQSAVKSIFNDSEMIENLKNEGYEMSSANSINWGRLAPQIVYYVSAYVDLVATEEMEEDEEVNFVVPTGNFGNVLAAYYAKKMGVPIKKLIVASNTNKVLTDFFETGRYDINREFYKTISPSMDILVSSNLERLLYEITGSAEEVSNAMNDLKLYGSYQVDDETFAKLKEEFSAYCASEAETTEAIDNFFDMFGYVLDPHTAVAVSGYYNYLSDGEDETKTVIVSTASPYKFSEDVYFALTGKEEKDGFKAVKKLSQYTGDEVPQAIEELAELPILHTLVVPKDEIKDAIQRVLAEKANN